MGSLPNLTEICRDNDANNLLFRSGLPPLNHDNQFLHETVNIAPTLPGSERCKIRYRQSERGDLPRPRRKIGQPRFVPFHNEAMLQHMEVTSPASARSTLAAHQTIKRRESLTSSIGATSERRLIYAMRSSHSRPTSRCNRRIYMRYLLIFCISHLLLNSTFLPFLVLQASVSVWTLPFHNSFPISIHIGSFLLTLMYALAAISTLLSPFVIRKLGINISFMISYIVFALFYGVHLYPVLYLLIPSYVLLGLVLGQSSQYPIALLMGLSSKMSCAMAEFDEDMRILRKTIIIRRFARAIQGAQDLGLILGSLIVSSFITFWQQPNYSSHDNSATNWSLLNYNAYIDNIFDVDEHGNRFCGATACASNFVLNKNSTDSDFYEILPRTMTIFLSTIFVAFSLLALITASIGLQKINSHLFRDDLEKVEFCTFMNSVRKSFTDVRLQLAAPLAVFVGMEQAFIYSDFSKSYVVCTLGVHHLNSVFLSMGILQSIAACTLSMLLKSIQRYYIVGVGFIFQCCVLMVQILWKPMQDDPALFYVIPAVWGVCNAIWEILLFSLLSALYTDNWRAPFCNSAFFRFFGLALSFGLHGYLCNWVKLYILSVFMLFAIGPFLWLEIRLARGRKDQNVNKL